jgi:hypothetical protein
MKKAIFAMMLVTSISRQTIAQTIPASINNPFEIPSGSLSIRYVIDLGKGNTLWVEMTDKEDIDKFKNIDSILTVFFKDFAPFKDSVTDELAAKRIDYLTDASGRKKIRIRNYKPLASSFVIQQGEVAALKCEQDTVNIIGIILAAPVKYGIRKPVSNVLYYKLSFFVNDFNDLQNINREVIREKFVAIKSNKRWIKNGDGNRYMKNGDKSVSSKLSNDDANLNGFIFQNNFSTSIQNYKNNFVPSLNIGFELVLNNGTNKKYLGFVTENHLLFTKDINGNVKTYENVFLTLNYKKTFNNINMFQVLPNLSLSYLVRRNGEFYDKNTFRLMLGKVDMYKETVSLEPCIYFTNFFKNITPSLRLSVQF